ncbi:MAG: ABC transporter permease [Desulfovibrio sp.]
MSFILEGIGKAFALLLSGDEETMSAIFTTIKTTNLSLLGSLIIGAPLGFLLGYFSFPGKGAIRLCVDTLLSFPTVVIGLIAYALFTAKGPLGGAELLFTIPGIAMAQTLLALPIVIALTASAIETQDKGLRDTLLTLGANPIQLLRTSLYEARFAVLLAAATAYGRIVSEVGISMMVGGNIKWHTRTITTAIALETGKGQFEQGIALGLVLLFIALVVNIVLTVVRRREC